MKGQHRFAFLHYSNVRIDRCSPIHTPPNYRVWKNTCCLRHGLKGNMLARYSLPNKAVINCSTDDRLLQPSLLCRQIRITRQPHQSTNENDPFLWGPSSPTRQNVNKKCPRKLSNFMIITVHINYQLLAFFLMHIWTIKAAAGQQLARILNWAWLKNEAITARINVNHLHRQPASCRASWNVPWYALWMLHRAWHAFHFWILCH